MDATLPKKPRRSLPNGETWNQRSWVAARRRAMTTLEPVCAAGDGPIDMDAPAFSPLSCEVDHKTPTSRGGSLYELDNLQLMHSRCNRKKGARMEADYSGIKLENPFPLSNNW